jgi:hypothetical protein
MRTESGEIFENFWQAHKVYPQVEKQNQRTSEWTWPAEIHIDDEDETDAPNDKWAAWHTAVRSHPMPIRRPNGRSIPRFSWYKGEALDLIQARKQIYIDTYQRLLRAHPTYNKLLDMFVHQNKNLIIVEPDGPLPAEFPDGMPVTLDLLVELQTETKRSNGTYHPYGHGYVIALTLLEDRQNIQAKRIRFAI